MNFSQIVAQIKDRVDLVEYVGRYVVLKRFGAYYKGLCPFHNEKTSSFTVRSEFYHCFGCGEHGDIFSFLQKIKQCAFTDVVKDLAQDLGIEIRHNIDNEYIQMQKLLKDFILQAQENVHLAGDYLHKRGITQQSIKQFQLGFVTQELLNKFHSTDPEIKQKLGIGYMLKDRLLFPIKSGGQFVGVGARILHDNLDNGPKYINSPDSVLFQKRRLLYGDSFFEQGKKETIICEGYTDVILISQIKGDVMYKAVAPLGTAFTHEQLLRLWQIDKHPYICFDGDIAGRTASLKAAKLSLQYLGADNGVKIVNLPLDMDPAEVILDMGAEKFHSAMQQSQDLSDYIIDRMLSTADSPEKIFHIKTELRQLLLNMQNRDARDIFAQFWKKRIDNHIFSLGIHKKQKPIEKLPYISDKQSPNLKILLGLLILKPEMLDYVYDKFLTIDMSQDMQEIQGMILEGRYDLKMEEYKRYIADMVKYITTDEEHIMLWLDTYKLYQRSVYQAELEKLKKEIIDDFTPQSWDRIMYLNNLLLDDETIDSSQT